jgi:hypothetical protein
MVRVCILHADNSGHHHDSFLKTPTNAKLMNIYNAQKASPQKWGKNTITLNHAGSGDNHTASNAHLRKHLIIQMLKMAQQWNGYSTQSKLI